MARISAKNIMENNFKIESISALPHEQRVIVEANELGIKAHALIVFINTNPIFEKLPSDEAERLMLQFNLMKSYFEVLQKRIENFSGLLPEGSVPELTFGQKAVGASFNPSFMPEVDKVKNLFAEGIDIMEAKHKKETEVLGGSWERNVLRTEAWNAAVRASSAVVKYLTWKN